MGRPTSMPRWIGVILLIVGSGAIAQGLPPAGPPTVPAAGTPGETLPPEPEEPPLPRYQVEIIIFAHTDADPNEEIFDHGLEHAGPGGAAAGSGPGAFIAVDDFGVSADEIAENGAAAGTLAIPGGTEPPIDAGVGAPTAIDRPNEASQLPGTGDDGLAASAGPFEVIDPFGRLQSAEAQAGDEQQEPFSFRLLRDDEYQLGDALATIDRLGAYRVLGHGGWIQDGLEEDAARPFDLSYLGITNPSGTMLLYLGRFLHMAVDLEYRVPATVAGPAGPSGPPGSAPLFPSLTELDVGTRYRLHTERNAFRSGELHYIDHPMFGVLLLVTPAPEQEQIPFDDTDVLAPAA